MNLNEILKYYHESHNVDFKRTEYPLGKEYNKTEFLKDISAMANHPSNEPKFIFIGVVEKDGLADSFIEISTLTDQAKYQQYLDNNIEPSIKFEYKQFEHEGYKLGCFIINGNTERPYLFKKEVQNAKNKQLEFRPGDGYIRVGSSTRKMVRSDYEKIYNRRTEIKDRKSDLKITPYIKECSNTIMQSMGLKCMDFKIENISNKSIAFDIEGHFYKNENYKILKKFEVDRMIIEESKSKFTPSFSMDFITQPDISILDLSFKYTETSVLVSRIKRINNIAAVEIAQNDFEEDVFLNEVLFYKENGVPINVELIIRSDDFTEGSLRQIFKI